MLDKTGKIHYQGDIRSCLFWVFDESNYNNQIDIHNFLLKAIKY